MLVTRISLCNLLLVSIEIAKPKATAPLMHPEKKVNPCSFFENWKNLHFNNCKKNDKP